MGNPGIYCGDCRTVFEDCCRVQGHDLTRIKLGCNDLNCPVCHYRMAVREAYKANSRLMGFWNECYKYGFDLGNPCHVITSPPASEYHCFDTAEDYSKINQRNLHYLKDIGLIAGCTVPHMIRGNSHMIRRYKAHEIDLSPSWHWHTVGFMPYGHKIKSDAFYAATGWVYKVIPIVKEGGQKNVLAYELNHAARYGTAKSSSHLLRWWGATSYNAMRLIESRTRKILECKACGSEKHRYYESYQEDQGEAYRVLVDRKVQLTLEQLERIRVKLGLDPVELVPRYEKITEYGGD